MSTAFLYLLVYEFCWIGDIVGTNTVGDGDKIGTAEGDFVDGTRITDSLLVDTIAMVTERINMSKTVEVMK